MVRCSVVGCPRSGATLLQAMLGAYTKVFTLPENHFFRKSLRGRRALLLGGFRASRALRDWLQKLGLTEHASTVPKLTLARRPVIRALVQIMDDRARRNGCSIWVEKSPGHVFVIDKMERYLPDARFIRVIRDGRAVVASLREGRRLYPTVWGKRSLGDLVELWNRAISGSARHVGKRNHLFIRYSALVTKPGSVLESLCQFLSVDFEAEMLEDYAAIGAQLARHSSEWIAGAGQPLRPPSLGKFESVLSKPEREFVESHLAPIPAFLQAVMQYE